jgi:hypothetical protein
MENGFNRYHLWCRQLLFEFSEICYKYSLLLQAPIFGISESNTQWGSWRAETREIRISSNLIRKYSWDITLQVLKHEIAHQICSEIFKDQTGGHGANFIKACELLGLSKRFHHSSCDFCQNTKGPESEGSRVDMPCSNIIIRIRKLLALAESANEHESTLAMKMASKLLKKYNLQHLDEDEQGNYTFSIINLKRKRIEEYQRRIIVILTRFFYVQAICSSLYDPLRDDIYKTFEIFGKQDNIQIAEYCYHFLEQKLFSLWKRNTLKWNGNKKILRNSYYLGLLQGFSEKLQEQDRISTSFEKSCRFRPGSSTTSELVIAADNSLKQFIHARHPRLSRRSRSGPCIYRDTFNNAVKIGRSIVLSKGITEDFRNKGKFLE